MLAHLGLTSEQSLYQKEFNKHDKLVILVIPVCLGAAQWEAIGHGTARWYATIKLDWNSFAVV